MQIHMATLSVSLCLCLLSSLGVPLLPWSPRPVYFFHVIHTHMVLEICIKPRSCSERKHTLLASSSSVPPASLRTSFGPSSGQVCGWQVTWLSRFPNLPGDNAFLTAAATDPVISSLPPTSPDKSTVIQEIFPVTFSLSLSGIIQHFFLLSFTLRKFNYATICLGFL